MENSIVWADIPVTDMERAKKFYSEILQVELMVFPGMESVAVLPAGPVSADLYIGKPSAEQGCTVYLNGDPDVDVILSRVEGAGGKILQPKTFRGEMIGHVAFFLDSEGNRVGIQSKK